MGVNLVNLEFGNSMIDIVSYVIDMNCFKM